MIGASRRSRRTLYIIKPFTAETLRRKLNAVFAAPLAHDVVCKSLFVGCRHCLASKLVCGQLLAQCENLGPRIPLQHVKALPQIADPEVIGAEALGQFIPRQRCRH